MDQWCNTVTDYYGFLASKKMKKKIVSPGKIRDPIKGIVCPQWATLYSPGLYNMDTYICSFRAHIKDVSFES